MKKLVIIVFSSIIAFGFIPKLAVAKKPKIVGKININTASSMQLRLLPRIGPKMAQRIINYRKKKKFSKISDIMKVRGIGPKTFMKLKQFITVGQETKITVKK